MTAAPQTDRYALDRRLEEERLTLQARSLDPISERHLREAGLEPGMRVLDLGSGMGDHALLVARLVGDTGQVVGVERDPGTLAAARRRIERLGVPGLELVEGDVMALGDIPGAPFDAVVGRLVLHYVPELRGAFQAAGLGEPERRGEVVVGGAADSLAYAWVAETMRSMAPAMEATGTATAEELELDTMEERLRTDVLAAGAEVVSPMLNVAWTRVPS
jgi:SAM-dependent methyltransferase